MSQRTIDETPESRAFVEKFHEDVVHLAGLVIEAFETHPTYLLSPVLRKLICDHAKKVEKQAGQLHYKLCADWLGDPPITETAP